MAKFPGATDTTTVTGKSFIVTAGGSDKGDIEGEKLLNAAASACDDKAAFRSTMNVPSGSGSVSGTHAGTSSGTNTGDQDLSGYATTATLALKAPLESPAFTGTPSVPTASPGTNTTQAASTAFAQSVRAANYEVSGYAARVEAAGGKVDSFTLGKLDQLVTEAKRDGWFSLVKEWYPFVGDGLSAALVKLVYQGATSTITNTNLVAADYDQLVGIGPLAANTNKVLSTGFIGSANGVTLASCTLITSLPTQNNTPTATSGPSMGFDAVPTSNQTDLGAAYFGFGLFTTGGGSQSGGAVPGHVVASGANGSTLWLMMDGVQTRFSSGSYSGGMTGEFKLFGVTSQSQQRWQTGPVGTTIIATFLTVAQAKLATAAVLRFERAIRAHWFSPDGLIGCGDSIMATQGATVTANGHIEKLARAMGLRLTNFGNHSSLLTADGGINKGIANMMADLFGAMPYPPERTLVISAGTNDGAVPVSDTTYATSLNAIVAAAVAARMRVLVCSPCYSSGATYTTVVQRQYAVKCAAAAITYGVMFADTNAAIADQTTPGDYMADATHPNDAGHTVMFQRAYARLLGRNERSVPLNFGSIAAGASADLTVEVLTARVGQNVSLSLPAAIDAGLVFNAFVSADDTVTVRCTNTTGSPIDPAAAFFTVCVHQ